MSTNTEVEAELEVLFAKAGITVPDDRKAAVVHGYAEVRAMAELIRSMDLTAVDEPANIYGFDPVLRGAAE